MTHAVSQDEALSGAAGRDTAERRLRADLSRGDLAPGQRLVEAEMGERYGVTRNSVRLALDALAAEGLVERVPNRGARVRLVSAEEAVAIMECRTVLDGLLSRKAAERATADQREQLQANEAAMVAAVDGHDLLRYSELIQDHHGLVQSAARHPAATALVARLHGQIVRRQFELSLRPGRAAASLTELRRVVAAVVAGDPVAAEAAARQHLAGVIDALRTEAGEAVVTAD